MVPLLWVLLAAFNGTAGLGVSWPAPWTLDNFRAVLDEDTTYRPMWNGLVLCGGATIITMVCSVLAAYPLSRYRSRFKRPFLLTVLFSTGLPITAIMVPVYGLFVQLNLIDTISGTILFMATTALPIAIWLAKNFMDAVPIELEEAAWTDGASPMQALWYDRAAADVAGPGGGRAVHVHRAVGELLRPVRAAAVQRPAAGLGEHLHVLQPVRPGRLRELAAYSLLYSLPAVLLYLLLSRRLGGAFTFGGAVKG